MNAPFNPQCTGKTQYASKADALRCLRHRTKTRRNSAKNGRGGSDAYRCDNCHCWHIGSLSFRPKERRR